jgi:LmbE family N-acetylglucosaminyl deacetylase
VELQPAPQDTVISFSLQGARRVLCIGAHSDDIEIGCGGTILRLIELSKDLEFYWIVFCSNADRAREAEASAGSFLRHASKKTVVIKSFRDGFLPYVGGEVKDCFEELKRTFDPDLIFTHFRHDLHQDHRLLCELIWNTYRNHMVLEYEIPKYDGDFRSPNFFVPLSKAICATKVQHLMQHFSTQRNKHWFSEDLFYSTLRIRGMEANSPTQFAEGFYCRKMILG